MLRLLSLLRRLNFLNLLRLRGLLFLLGSCLRGFYFWGLLNGSFWGDGSGLVERDFGFERLVGSMDWRVVECEEVVWVRFGTEWFAARREKAEEGFGV